LTVNKVQLHIRDAEPKPNRSLDRSLAKWGNMPSASAKMELRESNKNQLKRELEEAAANTARMQNGEAPEPCTGRTQFRDGKPVPESRPTRVARALVSTAAKGSIPTTLGGKMPPVSILSRREFGLRQLRK
jgi:hypothetical protein